LTKIWDQLTQGVRCGRLSAMSQILSSLLTTQLAGVRDTVTRDLQSSRVLI
jgi:hypothetical protein